MKKSIHEEILRISEPEVKKPMIPVYSPVFSGKEKSYLAACIEETWISSSGRFVSDFEKKFSDFVGANFAIATSSGTSALLLSLAVLGVNKGDEVIVPTFTMISTALAVVYNGAIPVFADCDEYGFTDPVNVENKITSKTRAIIPVDIYGYPADRDRFQKISNKYKIPVIYDAAESFGSMYKNKYTGSSGMLSAFSLYVNKVITAGQGGMITTQSEDLYRELKRLNNYYFSDERHFWHEKIGYNFRISNLQAAVGLAQIEKAGKLVRLKKSLNDTYMKYFSHLTDYLEQLKTPSHTDPNYWHIAFTLKNGRPSQSLRNYLAQRGIETRNFFIPLHLQPPFQKYSKGIFPNSEELFPKGIIFPSGPGLSKYQIRHIASLVEDFFIN